MRTIPGFQNAPASSNADSSTHNEDTYEKLADHCDLYKGADLRRSILQLTLSLTLFAAACWAMIVCVQENFWLGYWLLLLPTSGMLIRLIIVQHDCGHGSYFKTRRANDMVGRCIGVLTVTPYSYWRRTHNMHHAGSGNLERRGYGGIETLTLEEFKALSPAKRRMYRLYRHPLVLLIFGTPFFTIVAQRFPLSEPFPFPEISKGSKLKGIWRSVVGTNIGIVAFFGGLSFVFGGWPVLAVYLPVLIVTSWIGGWLFFIQHQFEDTYWENHEEWSFQEAALEGSSYYHLPPLLQWFTGNIGLHHIHHLCAMIPNYRLQECLDANKTLQEMNRMTLADSLKCVDLALWDEKARKLVSFRNAETV